jgi:hypothetical protein
VIVAAHTDPIASEIGHGAPGLRDGLRPFSELLEASASQKHVWLAMRAGKMLSGWSSDTTAGCYVIPWTETWAGILRDVVGVRTSSETPVRAETLTLCRATESTYYFNPDALDSGGRWDDGSLWDDGGLWDDVPLLYVHLTGGADPDATSVQAQAAFWIGSASVAQPNLGPEKLANADFYLFGGAAWAGFPNAPTGWTLVGAGVEPMPDTALGGESQLSARLDVTGLAAGAVDGLSQRSLAGVAGKMYRLSGWYKTAADNPSGLEARLRVGLVTGPYVTSDGRGSTSVSGFALAPTYGQVRRYCFDFYCPTDTADLEVSVLVGNTSGGAISSGSVWFDSPSLRRAWRFERAEHRLSLEHLPLVEQARPDSWFAPIARGAGTLSLLNGSGPGSLDAVMAGLDWIGQTFDVYAGGRFVNGGNEILLDDCWPALRGVIADRPEVRDLVVSLPFEDLLNRLQTQVPPNTYDADDISDLAQADQGRRKPLIFGTVDGVRPARVAKGTGAYLGLPIYELRDMSLAVSGPAALLPPALRFPTVTVHSYVDEEAAEARDATRRVTSTFVVADAETSRVPLLTDPRVIVVEGGKNDSLEFSVAGVTYTASLTPGLYSWAGTGSQDLAAAIQSTLNAQPPGAIFNLPTYDRATGLVTLTTSGVAFAILTGTGPWVESSFWRELGFTTRADLAAAVSQTGDSSITHDCDELIVRMDGVTGYLDDASGTYTGTAFAYIEKAPDVLRFLLVRVAGADPGEIRDSTFEASRTGMGAESLAAYLGAGGEESDLSVVVERIENSVRGDLTVRRGKFEFGLRTSSTAAASLVERDYLDFVGTYDQQDVLKVIRLAYGQDPASGKWRTKQQTTAAVALRFSRTEQRTFETYLSPATTAGAQATRAAMLDLYVAEATAKRRRFSLAVRGKLFLLALGAVVELGRDRGLDVTGALSSVQCRIVRKVDGLETWATTAELIEVV